MGGCGGGNGGGNGSSSGMGDSGMGDTSVPPPDTGPDTMPPPDTGVDMPILMPCASPVFMPAAGAVVTGTDVVITAPGLDPSGIICYTTDGTIPSSMPGLCKPYGAGTTGIPVAVDTTFKAISTTMGKLCSDSPEVDSAYTVMPPPPGTLPPPAFAAGTPGQTTFNNPFTVVITDMSMTTTATNICYTLDGSTPACGAGGGCSTGTSIMNGGSVSIGPANATNASMPGAVALNAIGCAANATGTKGGIGYTLQAATPTMSPAPGANTYSPTLTGAFQDVTGGTTVYYTTDGTMPSCAGGGTQKTYGTPFALLSGTYYAIACEAGFADSAVAGPFAIAVTLPNPSLSPGAGTYNSSQSVSALNAGQYPSGSWVCYSTSANGNTTSAPSCGANGACATGSTAAVSPANGGQVQAIACAPAGYSNSAVATVGPYALATATPFINPDGTNAAGAPLPSYSLPTGEMHPTIQIGKSLAAGVQTGSWLCYQNNPATPVSCSATANMCTVGTPANGPFPQTVLGATVVGGDTIEVIACPTAASGFGPSTIASTTIVGTGQAKPPTLSNDTTNTASLNGPFQQPVNVALVNANTSAVTVCYTTDGSAATCTAGSTTGGCSTIQGSNAGAVLPVSYFVETGGAGYTVAPFVSFNTLACTGNPTATINAAGAVTGITGGTCTGVTQQPTVTLTTGSGFSADAALQQAFTFNVSSAGTNYGGQLTVKLSGNSGSTPATCTLKSAGAGNTGLVYTNTPTGGGIQTITITPANATAHCPLFTSTPTITSIAGATGSGAAASVSVVQNVTITPANFGGSYTTFPTISLKPATGTGACTLTPVPGTATDTGVGTISAVNATNCSGFTDLSLTVDVKDPKPPTTQAVIVGYAANMALVPTIQGNPTTINAKTCSAGLTVSPNATYTYKFVQPDPIVVYQTPGVSGFTLGGAAITASNTLLITTVSAIQNSAAPPGNNIGPTNSAFGDVSIVWSNNPAVMPNCMGAGNMVAGPSVTIDKTTMPAPGSSFTIRAIACSANQAISNLVTSGTYTVSTANPVVAATAGGQTLDLSTLQAGGSITAFNAASATMACDTTGSYMCYTTAGATPSCDVTQASGCQTGSTKYATPIAITSGMAVRSVCCAADVTGATMIDQSLATAGGAGGIAFTQAITPVTLVGTASNQCPGMQNVGFDPMDPNYGTNGGPTVGATVCYSFTSQPVGCPIPPPAGVLCFTPSAATPNQQFTDATNQDSPIYTTACLTGFDTQALQQAFVPKNVWTTPAVTVDGVLMTDWAATDLVAGSQAGITGGVNYAGTNTPPFAYNVTDVYLATGGIGATATDVWYYLGDGSTTGSTTGKNAETLPFHAQWAIDVPNVTTPTPASWQFTGGAWVAAPAGFTVNAAQTGAAQEVDISGMNAGNPFNPAATANVAAFIEKTGATQAWWPVKSGTSTLSYFSEGLYTCQTPASTVQ
jgi:hypothetical protein